MFEIQSLKESLFRNKYLIDANLQILHKTRQELKDFNEQLKTLELASETLKTIGEDKKKGTILVFEKVITEAIREVFGFNYQFKVDVSKEGKPKTEFKLLDNGKEIDIMNSVGGGLIDVISFVLRILVLVSVKPRRRRILFLDEPFRNVSENYRPQVAKLIKSLSQQLDLQIVMVSHQQEFIEIADKAYLLEKTENGTKTKQY